MTETVVTFKPLRTALRLSQSGLARISGVSRVRICLAEIGDVTLTESEQDKIRAALKNEIARLQSLPSECAQL